MRVCTIIGTRPEIIKLSQVILKLDQILKDDHIIVHTGQHFDYELNDVFFKDLGLRQPDVFLGAKNTSAIELIAQTLVEFEKVLEDVRPDCVLIYGDTNSCLSAYVAKRKRIPIFHMEAGNRCFDARVPEEINRKIIDHLSDVNLTITEHARRYLISEGFPQDRIFKVGSSMPQVLEVCKSKIQASSVLEGLGLEEDDYYLLSIHREENLIQESYVLEFIKLLNILSNTKRVVVTTHPKTRSILSRNAHFSALEQKVQSGQIRFEKPFGFVDFIKLQKHAYCTISDSGTIMEEASLLQIPAVTIRDSFERPEGLDEGILVVSDWDTSHIENCVRIVRLRKLEQQVLDYQGGDVANKVVSIIFSMTHQIKRKTYYDN